MAKELLAILSSKQEFEKEIESTKEQTFDDFSKTLYELWNTKDLNQLVGYLKNKNVKEFIISEKNSLRNFRITTL